MRLRGFSLAVLVLTASGTPLQAYDGVAVKMCLEAIQFNGRNDSRGIYFSQEQSTQDLVDRFMKSNTFERIHTGLMGCANGAAPSSSVETFSKWSEVFQKDLNYVKVLLSTDVAVCEVVAEIYYIYHRVKGTGAKLSDFEPVAMHLVESAHCKPPIPL